VFVKLQVHGLVDDVTPTPDGIWLSTTNDAPPTDAVNATGERISMTADCQPIAVLPVTLVAVQFVVLTASVSDATSVATLVSSVIPVGAVAAALVLFPPNPTNQDRLPRSFSVSAA